MLPKFCDFLTAPVQFIAAYQTRLERYCQRIAEQVPAERRIEVPPRIAGPVLEALRFADEQDLVTELMLNLLSAGMDTERVETAHPAFAGIVVQLSRYEALLLFHLAKGRYMRRTRKREPPDRKREVPPGYPEYDVVETLEETSHRASVAQPRHFDVYISHLTALGLVDYTVPEFVSVRMQPEEVIVTETTQLTVFGQMFAKACVPDQLPSEVDR